MNEYWKNIRTVWEYYHYKKNKKWLDLPHFNQDTNIKNFITNNFSMNVIKNINWLKGKKLAILVGPFYNEKTFISAKNVRHIEYLYDKLHFLLNNKVKKKFYLDKEEAIRLGSTFLSFHSNCKKSMENILNILNLACEMEFPKDISASCYAFNEENNISKKFEYPIFTQRNWLSVAKIAITVVERCYLEKVFFKYDYIKYNDSKSSHGFIKFENKKLVLLSNEPKEVSFTNNNNVSIVNKAELSEQIDDILTRTANKINQTINEHIQSKLLIIQNYLAYKTDIYELSTFYEKACLWVSEILKCDFVGFSIYNFSEKPNEIVELKNIYQFKNNNNNEKVIKTTNETIKNTVSGIFLKITNKGTKGVIEARDELQKIYITYRSIFEINRPRQFSYYCDNKKVNKADPKGSFFEQPYSDIEKGLVNFSP
jgi:hypothetical protein